MGKPVPEKKIFEGFEGFNHIWHGGHLGHVTWIYTLVPLSYRWFIQNLAMIGEAVSEKKMFK